VKEYSCKLCVLLLLLSCSIASTRDASEPQSLDPNEINEKIFNCAMEPNMSELVFHANQIKDPNLALEVLEKIESIRPNCIDIQISKMLQYGLLGENQKFHLTDLKIKELRQKEKVLYGTSPPIPSQTKPSPTKISEGKEPPLKKDKINYWKWLYIYSQVVR
jgi:hypothetical protein